MAKNTKNVYIRMSEADENRLDVLCSIHRMSRPVLVSKLLEIYWTRVSDSGRLGDWLNSLATESKEQTPAQTA